LSTVKNADQIVVLEKGEIVEVGTHTELVEKRGAYFNLVKNQLELGD
jgi:ATP-binding cassette, subfamily B, bacterial